MALASFASQVKCSIEKPSSPRNINLFVKTSLSSMPLIRDFQPITLLADASKTIKCAYDKILDAFVDSVFEFSDQPLPPSQKNFAPIDEVKEPVVLIGCIEGVIPDDFPEGIYIRNGANPLFGGYKSTVSIFGRSSHAWIEGEGMLHAIYFDKKCDGSWNVVYKNKFVETQTYKIDKLKSTPSFLPGIEGDSLAILAAYLLNFIIVELHQTIVQKGLTILSYEAAEVYVCFLRIGNLQKPNSNTSVFEHSGKLYAIAENHMPQEIDRSTLEVLGTWDVNGAWKRSFTSHPKKVPGTGELVILGVDALKPFLEVGVISADGKLVHRVDLKLDRCSLCHEMGVTERYNLVMDMALTADVLRLIRGGPLIKYDKKAYARVGVFPRYGDESSIKWFKVEPNCTFHVLNCFEDGDEVVMWACKASASIVPGPDFGLNKSDWFASGFEPIHSVDENGNEFTQDGLLFPRLHEWRLNLRTGKVKEKYLNIRSELVMEFPMINEAFTGIKNKYGYMQVGDRMAIANSGLGKFVGLAKVYFDEQADPMGEEKSDEIKVEYHMFPENTFFSGAAFVPKKHGEDEDDGWIIAYAHNETTDVSEVYIVDTKNFLGQPIAKITLPTRVPYGFHGAFIPN